MSKQCTCADDLDAKLADRNAKLKRAMMVGGKPHPGILIETEKVETRKRGKAPAVLPSFCPFCGTKYATDE